MKIATTINIGKDHLARLVEIADNSEISVQGLVTALLSRYANDRSIRNSAFTPVRYQKRRGSDQWKRIHVSLRGDEYEFCIDLRKVCKMSVSFLVAYAIEHFLDDLIVKLKNNVDSYRYRNYAIMNIMLGNVSCWVTYWGIPSQLLTP